MIVWICLLSVLCSAALCLYLANGQLALFKPGGLHHAAAGLLEPADQSEQKPADDEDAEEELPVLQPLPLQQRLQNLKTNRRLQLFGVLAAAAAAAFCWYRSVSLVNAPALNVKYMLLLFLFLAAAVIDAQYYIIPNAIVAAGLVLWGVVTVYAVLVEQNPLPSVLLFSLLGGLFSGGVLLMCRFLMKGSLGMGDIKLMAVTGLICGFFKVFNILFYALLFSFVCGVVLLALKKADRKSQIPMAPFLLCGYLFANLIAV